MPFNTRWEGYVFNQDGSASWNAAWLDYRKVKALIINASWTAVAATAGTLAVQGTEDSTLAAGSLVTLTATVTHGAQPSGGTAGAIVIVIENPTSFIRLTYARSAGGGANQFSAYAHGRSI